MPAEKSPLPQLVRSRQAEILTEWMSLQLASVAARRDLISENDLRQQSREFLEAVRAFSREPEFTGAARASTADDTISRAIGSITESWSRGPIMDTSVRSERVRPDRPGSRDEESHLGSPGGGGQPRRAALLQGKGAGQVAC